MSSSVRIGPYTLGNEMHIHFAWMSVPLQAAHLAGEQLTAESRLCHRRGEMIAEWHLEYSHYDVYICYYRANA